MKIAEFFAELGFDIKGDVKLADVDKALSRIAMDAIPVLSAVAGMNVGFAALADAALKAVVSFKNFDLQTGLSLEKLRAWQHLAQVNDVSPEALADTIKGLQSAQAEIRLGRGNIAPWQLLGISPNTDPFTVLELLRKKIQTLPPDMARVIAGQMGIGDQMFQMLRNANKEFDELDRRLILTDREFRGMKEVNRAWQDFTFALASIRDRIVAQFHEPMRVAVKLLRTFLDVLIQFTDWVSSGTTAANFMKYALWGLAAVFFLATFAASGLIIAIGLLKTGILALTVAAAPLFVPLFLLLATLGLITFAIVGLTLLLDDFWGAFYGKESAMKWDNEIAAIHLMASAVENLIALWKLLTGQFRDAMVWHEKANFQLATAVGGGKAQASLAETSSIKDLVATAAVQNHGFIEELTSFLLAHFSPQKEASKWWEPGALKEFIGNVRSGATSPSLHQENNIRVLFQGNIDPANGAATGKSLGRELVNAAAAAPVGHN